MVEVSVVGRRAASAGLAAVMSLGVLAGCGGRGGENESGGDKAKPATRQSLSQPGTAVLVWCAPGETGWQVSLAALSMSKGNTVASASFRLPDGTTPSLDCDVTDFSAGVTSPAWTRAVFDRAFRRMAVTITDEATDAERASTVDAATGEPAPLPSPSQEFASTPKEQRAVFHPTTGDLWFVDQATSEVMSRDGSSARTTRHGKLPGDDATSLAIGAKGFFPIDNLQQAVVAPDGEHAVVDEQGEAYLVRVGEFAGYKAPSIGHSTLGTELPGPDASCTTAQTWLDDRNLLCDNSTTVEPKFSLITFSADRTSITGSRNDLLPETNRRNYSAVASPDGQSFAFLSLQGRRVTLYRQSLKPGSTPAKIAEVEAPTTMANAVETGTVPVLLAWQ